MAVNVELLKQVRDKIAQEPKRLDMGVWASTRRTGSDAPPCGTVGCIAGWIVFCARPELMDVRHPEDWLYDNEDKDLDEYALELAGLEESENPFYMTEWGVPEVIAWIDRQIDAAAK